MIQTNIKPNKNIEKKDNDTSAQALDKNSKATDSDPLKLSQRNNEKLNLIIEEVRNLLESDSS
jgi:hypothetical protein